MVEHILVVESYFDGHTHLADGPYTIQIEGGVIADIVPGDRALEISSRPDMDIHRAAFAMPGLAEAHSHLFLEGVELNFKKRSAYLKADPETMLKVARNSVQKSLLAGVTLIRDAGDIHGINTTIRAELEQTNGLAPNLQIAGIAIRKTGRYGSFMAREVNDAESLLQAIRSLASNVDHLKILMTGIIDFKLGKVKGSPQFTLEEAGLIVKTARELDLPTFAHCSGLKGIQTAVEAGIDSIEHGFFINRQVLQKMADKQIAWVPTFSPVDFQWARPELAGWDAETVQKLRNILDSHNEHLLMAEELGVPLVAGSDAGSYGVEHGMALIDELIFMAQAGLPLQSVLQSATSRPRKCWGVTSADIQKGTSADLILLEESPFTSVQNLKKVQTILKDGFVFNQALAVY